MTPSCASRAGGNSSEYDVNDVESGKKQRSSKAARVTNGAAANNQQLAGRDNKAFAGENGEAKKLELFFLI